MTPKNEAIEKLERQFRGVDWVAERACGYVEVPCQSCQKPVAVPIGFVGCVLCVDCQTAETYDYTTEEGVK